MNNMTSYTDEQVLSAIEALGSYETMCGFAHILASVHADRTRLQAEVEESMKDSDRLDWLAIQHVEVRSLARYGTRLVFIASPHWGEEEESPEPWDIREAIDSARAKKVDV